MFGDIENDDSLQLLGVLPKLEVQKAPAGVPEPIARSYIEGKSILRARMWTPAATAFRTSLDRATKILWVSRGIEGDIPFKLEKRLRVLKEKLFLPEAMMAWVESIRVVGNEMHELEEVTFEDAEDVGHFAEMFLTYMFTLPDRVAAFKARRPAEG